MTLLTSTRSFFTGAVLAAALLVPSLARAGEPAPTPPAMPRSALAEMRRVVRTDARSQSFYAALNRPSIRTTFTKGAGGADTIAVRVLALPPGARPGAMRQVVRSAAFTYRRNDLVGTRVARVGTWNTVKTAR